MNVILKTFRGYKETTSENALKEAKAMLCELLSDNIQRADCWVTWTDESRFSHCLVPFKGKLRLHSVHCVTKYTILEW